jgi:hypothetical protein
MKLKKENPIKFSEVLRAGGKPVLTLGLCVFVITSAALLYAKPELNRRKYVNAYSDAQHLIDTRQKATQEGISFNK